MIDDFLQQNRAWAAERVAEDPDYFKRLVEVQSPRALWIGCSDSRVPANMILGLAPGEIFVHRNVANMVHPNDLSCLTAVQFAVQALKVTDIIVCGHYGCGGIEAAYDGVREGMLPYWLHPVRSLMELAGGELAPMSSRAERLDRLCELNVEAQMRQLANTPILEEAWKGRADLTIHGLVYRLTDGLLKVLGSLGPDSPPGKEPLPWRSHPAPSASSRSSASSSSPPRGQTSPRST